jgi:hypothetical protein
MVSKGKGRATSARPRPPVGEPSISATMSAEQQSMVEGSANLERAPPSSQPQVHPERINLLRQDRESTGTTHRSTRDRSASISSRPRDADQSPAPSQQEPEARISEAIQAIGSMAASMRDLMAGQTQLLQQFAERSATQRNLKPPTYNCSRLSRRATPAEREDWIQAIREGNETKPNYDEKDYIMWACTKLEQELQTDWRSHANGIRQEPREPTTDDFFKFIRNEHISKNLTEHDLRERLFIMRQTESESPTDLFHRWAAVHRRLGDTVEETNPGLAFDYWRRLVKWLRDSLQRNNTPLLSPREVAERAQQHWALDSRNRTGDAFPRKKRNFDNAFQNPPRPEESRRSKATRQTYIRSPRNGAPPWKPERPDRDRGRPLEPPPSRDHPDGATRPEVTCYACGKPGHVAKDCHDRRTRGAPREHAPIQALEAQPEGRNAELSEQDLTDETPQSPEGSVSDLSENDQAQ